MSQLASHLRRMWRAALTAESLLSADEACEAMPCPGPATRDWLVAHVQPFGELVGVPVYRWGHVVAAIAGARGAEPVTTWLSTGEAAVRLGIARSTLDEMVSRAPKDLPGAPVHVGSGKTRAHLRWDAGRLQEWLAAYRSWEARSARKGAVAPTHAPARTMRRAKADDDGPVDWGAVARQFGK